MRNSGYTLLELVVSAAIFAIVSGISMVALMSATKTASMTEAQAQVQANLRTAMSEMALELRSAYSQRLVDASLAPEDAESIRVSGDGASVTFQIPVLVENQDIVGVSTPITYRFENEDLPEVETGVGNTLLDEGEDANGDGVLTRRMMRVQDGAETIVGLPNEISLVRFSLEPNPLDGTLTTLRIEIEGAKRYAGRSENEIVRARLESSIRIEN
jgi:prepilin-type N-terminal cleavage/methylation domain-containing protein